MRRAELDGMLPIEIEPHLNPGDYAKSIHGLWILRAPNGDLGTLRPKIHQIEENADGTITVSPSIQFETGQRYHGYLKQGVWS
jgi:hypothetical protein